MNKVYFLIFCFVITNCINPLQSLGQNGITVAGGSYGSAANQLNGPSGVFLDAGGNIYISDASNNRIQKWAPGASAGITVAGGNGKGAAANQLNVPQGIFVDANSNVYVADYFNNRVQKWAPGAPEGVTVAGGNGQGSAANQLSNPYGVFVDGEHVYVADYSNHRVQKWAPGASEGVTVAGGNGKGWAANQLAFPADVFVDATGDIYISDASNNRVQKWAPGASSGTTVAGGNGQGAGANQLAGPSGIFVDAAGNVYIADKYNYRIQQWAPGASTGLTVAGGNGQGGSPNQLPNPYDVFVDAAGNIYVADYFLNSILRFSVPSPALNGSTVAGGNGVGSSANQLNRPYSVSVDANGNIYIADTDNNRVQKWAPGASSGELVAGYLTPGSSTNQLRKPKGIFLSSASSLFIADSGNNRIQRWDSAYTFANASISADRPVGVAVDRFNNIYYAEKLLNRVQMRMPGATASVTVAGNQFQFPGSSADRLYHPAGIFVDADRNLYIADELNHRIQKWAPGASAGITVAGGNGQGGTASQLAYPAGVFVDATGNVYVADAGNNRIQKWAPGASSGITVAGGFGSGAQANQLNNPTGVWVVPGGIIYVADNGNHRIQKIVEGSALTYKYYEGSFDALPDFNALTPVKTGNSANVDLGVRTSGRDDNFAFVWQGYINITTPGTYTFETISDDGSKLYFNSLYNPSATATVNNDGLHAATPATGTVSVTAAGVYPITFTYFEKDGGETMQVYWTGPGIERQLIPSSAFTQGAPPPPPPPSNGLTYKYYEGSFNALPDFNALNPVKTGTTPNVDISVRPAGVSDNFAFLWQGTINIPTAGDYTFETISDDGSKLYFNMQYDPAATATVNNDGLHAPASATGTVNIPAAGIYPIVFTFFEKDGGETMQVYWSGPGISRQLIPASAFTQAQPPSNGLTYKYYEGTWNTLPDFNALTPVKTGNSDNADISVRTPGRNDNFGFLWQGYINLPAAGNYTFETISDDGSKLYFNAPYNPAATATVNNDGLHAPTSATGTVQVPAAGAYPIAITFFEKDGGETMQVYWSGPGFSRQLIPGSAFTQIHPVSGSLVTSTNPSTDHQVEITKTDAVTARVYPNPFSESFHVNFYNASIANDIAVSIYDLKGRMIYRQHAGKLPAGNTTLKVDLDGQHLPSGVYMAGLQINGVPSKMIKLVRMK